MTMTRIFQQLQGSLTPDPSSFSLVDASCMLLLLAVAARFAGLGMLPVSRW